MAATTGGAADLANWTGRRRWVDSPAPTRIAFDLARPATEAKALLWKRLMRYVTSDVAMNPGAYGSPLVVRQVFRLIVAAALETFPNTAGDDLRRAPGPASSGAVRRATAFIEERAGADIDLTDIADAAHVGPRALQRAFRRSLDTTPLGYLRGVRMDRAHDELRAADPADGATVARVAARWGFGHPGRFATAYRAVRPVAEQHAARRLTPNAFSARGGGQWTTAAAAPPGWVA